MNNQWLFASASALALIAAMSMRPVSSDDMTGAGSMKGTTSKEAAKDDRALIASAMRAAPKNVAAKASVVVAGADGKMRTLREGSNGFNCMPDNPTTPGPDPMCMDKPALAWAEAWMSHKNPPPGRIGFMYMLAGGTDAKAFAKLGIRCFGFAPLQLPPTLDFGALFHGVDERVPVDAITFGTRVLGRFLRAV